MAARAVVCVSFASGSHGAEVGKLAADRLGYLYVDEQIIAHAAAEGGLEPRDVADEERRKTFAIRMLEALAHGGRDAWMVGGVAPVTMDYVRSSEIRTLIRDTIVHTAARGNVVILAHAASYAVDRGPRVLRVFVTASPAVRAQRLAATDGISQDEAARLVKDSDSGRRDYLKRFYAVDGEAPTDYDLVVNTDVLTADQAAEIVVHAADR